MKYKNHRDKLISRREKEIRRLSQLSYGRWRRNRGIVKETVEPFQDGWDVYFDVDPIYKGTVLEDKVWDVLPYLMRVGWEGESGGPRYRERNENGYRYSGSPLPYLEGIDEELYTKIKAHDLFYKKRDFYLSGREIVYTNKLVPNFERFLVTVKEPRMVTEISYLDEIAAQEDSEVDARLEQLKNGKSWYAGVKSKKEWKKLDHRGKRRRSKMNCKKMLYMEDPNEVLFERERKDILWQIY